MTGTQLSNEHTKSAQTQKIETVLKYENAGKTKDFNDLNNDSQNSNGSTMEKVVKEINCRLIQEEMTAVKKELKELKRPTTFKSMIQMGGSFVSLTVLTMIANSFQNQESTNPLFLTFSTLIALSFMYSVYSVIKFTKVEDRKDKKQEQIFKLRQKLVETAFDNKFDSMQYFYLNRTRSISISENGIKKIYFIRFLIDETTGHEYLEIASNNRKTNKV